jgi:hypothetical protein
VPEAEAEVEAEAETTAETAEVEAGALVGGGGGGPGGASHALPPFNVCLLRSWAFLSMVVVGFCLVCMVTLSTVFF